MKTIIIFNQIEEQLEYVIVDGDFTRFNGCCINACEGNGYEDEFVDWFFDDITGDKKFETTTNIDLLEQKEWDKVVLVTWLP